jgi:TolB-like protein/Tfp pilus assembly protein PilF
MPVLRFGEFELNEQTLELRGNGKPIRIQQQPARVLAFLLKNCGYLVTREQIRVAIWGESTYVDFEQGLNFCIRQIRLALKDDAHQPLYIETLPRLGYRFVGKLDSTRQALEAAAPQNRRIRIAVIPLEDRAASAADYFAAGLTEDMVSALSRIDPSRLRVTTISESQKGDFSPDQIDRLQRQLNLDYLIRGSVRRSAEKLRITAQLHDLGDKSVLWSETYDRNADDLLAVQEDVTRRVSQSLALELLPGASVGARRYSRSSAAYDAYLKGRFLWHKMTTDGIRRSIAYFNEALSRDSAFAPAYAGLADCYAQMGSVRVGQMKPLQALETARSYLRKALELDDTLPEAHCTLGLIRSWYELDWSGAEREFQTALELDSSHITALLWQSLLLAAVGRGPEAIRSVQRAREIDPLSVSVNLYLGVAQHHAGQLDLAVRQFQYCLELDPGYYRSYMFMGRALISLDRFDEAVATLSRATELAPDNLESMAFLGSALAGAGDRESALKMIQKLSAADERTEPAILIAAVYAQLGLVDEFFATLNRALEVRSTPLYLSVLCPETLRYRNDARFHSFLAAVGLDDPSAPRRQLTNRIL